MKLLQQAGRLWPVRWLLAPVLALAIVAWWLWRARRLDLQRSEALGRMLRATLDLNDETRRAEAKAEVARDAVRVAHETAVANLHQTERQIADLHRETLATELNRVFGRSANRGETP